MNDGRFWDFNLDTCKMTPADCPQGRQRIERIRDRALRLELFSEDAYERFRTRLVEESFRTVVARATLWGFTATAYRSEANVVLLCVEHSSSLNPGKEPAATWLTHPSWAGISGLVGIGALLIAVLGLWVAWAAFQATLTPAVQETGCCTDSQTVTCSELERLGDARPDPAASPSKVSRPVNIGQGRMGIASIGPGPEVFARSASASSS